MKLFDVLKYLIKNAKTKKQKEELLKKIDILYSFGRLTDEEYTELVRLLNLKDDTDTEK